MTLSIPIALDFRQISKKFGGIHQARECLNLFSSNWGVDKTPSHPMQFRIVYTHLCVDSGFFLNEIESLHFNVTYNHIIPIE